MTKGYSTYLSEVVLLQGYLCVHFITLKLSADNIITDVKHPVYSKQVKFN
jgi:hypothetical protein